MNHSSDADLLAILAGGPPEAARSALGELYTRYAGDVRRFLGRMLTNQNDIEDIVQDTFLAAARRAEAFQRGEAGPWLLSLAARRARDLLRRQRRAGRRAALSMPEHRPAAAGPGLVGDVAVALDSLAPRERVVLELRYVQGLTHEQAASVLGVSPRTIKTWSSRALAQLRARLAEMEAGG